MTKNGESEIGTITVMDLTGRVGEKVSDHKSSVEEVLLQGLKRGPT